MNEEQLSQLSIEEMRAILTEHSLTDAACLCDQCMLVRRVMAVKIYGDKMGWKT